MELQVGDFLADKDGRGEVWVVQIGAVTYKLSNGSSIPHNQWQDYYNKGRCTSEEKKIRKL
jgi:hypothetical protein